MIFADEGCRGHISNIRSHGSADPRAKWPRRQDSRNLVYLGIGIVGMTIALGCLALGDPAVDWLVREDGLVEWIGAIGLLVGSGLFLASAVLAWQKRRVGAPTVRAIVLLLLAIALFFFFGEEISWGQRVLGFGTPETLAETNAQDETNFHNINFLQGGLVDGDRLFRIWWISLFVLVPVACRLWPGLSVRLREFVPIVPLWLAGLFVASWVTGLVALNLFESITYTSIYPVSHSISEVQESTVEVLMAICGLLTLRRVAADGPLDLHQPADRPPTFA